MTTTTLRLALSTLAMGLALSACTEEPKDAAEIVDQIDSYIGKRVTMKAKFRPGIRCRLDTGDEEKWVTYCRDCQVCKGPFVVDLEGEDAEAWPMILGGTWDMKDIRCKGPLNDIECYPFEIGKTYIVEGVLERSTPPKLFVDGWKEAES